MVGGASAVTGSMLRTLSRSMSSYETRSASPSLRNDFSGISSFVSRGSAGGKLVAPTAANSSDDGCSAAEAISLSELTPRPPPPATPLRCLKPRRRRTRRSRLLSGSRPRRQSGGPAWGRRRRTSRKWPATGERRCRSAAMVRSRRRLAGRRLAGRRRTAGRRPHPAAVCRSGSRTNSDCRSRRQLR